MNKPLCNKPAVYRYTWPGRNEAFICEQHAQGIRVISNAMGFYVQLIEVEPEDGNCEQKVS